MHKAINAKFKKGDRVVYAATGEHGVIKSNYAPYEYAVRFDGHRLDSWVAEEKLRAENSNLKASNAYISSKRELQDELDAIEEDMNNPDWGWEWRAERKFLDELKPFAAKYGKMSEWQYVDGLVRRAKNSATIANAKFNVGDFVLVEQFGSGYKRGKVVSLSGPNAKVEFVGGGTDTVPLHRLTASNCSTANSVVAKAVANARAANAAFKVGDKVKANPKFLEFCPPEMKGREWTVTSVYGLGLGDGGGFFDLKSGDKRLSGIPSVKCVAANATAEPTVANEALDIWKTRKDELNEIHDIASFEGREFSKFAAGFLSVVDKIEGKWTSCKERMLKKAASTTGVAKSDLTRLASVCEDGRDRMIRARKLLDELRG